jgi:molybdopterin molybdotransferase
MISFDEAERRFLALGAEIGVDAWSAERVAVDAAAGRVLAEDVCAPFDLPSFDYSAMDGYAVATASFGGGGPWTLPVLGESRTGGVLEPLVRGCACRIFTGAPVPAGADAVVMQERVTRTGDQATFDAKPKAGAHIRRRGEDLASGAVALAKGTRLRAAHVGLAATCDRAWLEVARRPLVTIISTGDELRPPGSGRADGSSIPESNGVALRAMAERAGAVARVGPIAADDRAATARAFAKALEGCDVLVTVGGVSVGDHDWVRPALEESAVVLDFWKVAIKPGKPLLLGRRGRSIVVGLPGNPASAMITFALIGVPLLRALQGDRAPVASSRRVRCAGFARSEPGRMEFVRATLARDGAGETWATPATNQASGATSSLAHADALLRVPADVTSIARGEPCEVQLLEDLGA